MSATGYVVKKTTSSIAKRLTPHFSNWFLRKYYPLKAEDIVIEFSQIPFARINYDRHEYGINAGFTLRNFSFYKIDIHYYECRISIDGSTVASIKESKLFTLKAGATFSVNMDRNLTDGEVKRLLRNLKAKILKLSGLAL